MSAWVTQVYDPQDEESLTPTGSALQRTQAGNNAATGYWLQSEGLSGSVRLAPTSAGAIAMAPSQSKEHPSLCFRPLVALLDLLNAAIIKMEYCGRYLEGES